MSSLEKTLYNVRDWFDELREDGPDLTINGHKKAAHEAVELADEPSLEELADVVICLVAVCIHNGWTMAEVETAIKAKNAINKERTWFQKPDGTWQHNKGER
jgi:hypothetical protein